jgi:hypothetical protein
MNRTLSLVALLAATTFAHAGPVNLLTNGGFESTAIGNGTWTNVGSIAGWSRTAGPGSGFEVRNNVAGAAQEGRNYLELDTNGNTTIAQSLASLGAGGIYDVSFWYSPREGVAASSNGIEVYWNGLLLDSVTGPGARSGNVWSLHTYKVTAKAGTNVLSFASVGTSDSIGGNLDNVSLSNHVPEPGSLALTLAALAGIAFLPRRLRRNAEARRAAALASTLTRA